MLMNERERRRQFEKEKEKEKGKRVYSGGSKVYIEACLMPCA
jgi:hypothetical protein